MAVLERCARRAGAIGRVVCAGSALVLALAVSASAQAPDTEDKAAKLFRTVELAGLVDGDYV